MQDRVHDDCMHAHMCVRRCEQCRHVHACSQPAAARCAHRTHALLIAFVLHFMPRPVRSGSSRSDVSHDHASRAARAATAECVIQHVSQPDPMQTMMMSKTRIACGSALDMSRDLQKRIPWFLAMMMSKTRVGAAIHHQMANGRSHELRHDENDAAVCRVLHEWLSHA